MQLSRGCMQEDTDSSGDEQGASPPSAQGDHSLSLEEFTRLQDELMALKMYHEELLGERRWLQRKDAEKAPIPAPSIPAQAPSAWPNAQALSRSFSSQVKVGTEALSSLGALGVASLTQRARAEEGLRSEAESLRRRIAATEEEAQEFRNVAAAARAAAEAQRHAEGPDASPGSTTAPEGQDPVLDEEEDSGDDEDTVLLKQKIKAQREELDRLREIFQRQQEQVAALQDTLSGKAAEKQKQVQREVQAKLRDTETQAEGLLRQLRNAEAESRQSVELRQQLRDFAEQSLHRESVLAEMRSVFEQQAAMDRGSRERLAMLLAELQSFAWNRPRGQAPDQAAAPGHEMSPCSAGGELSQHADKPESDEAAAAVSGEAQRGAASRAAVASIEVQGELDLPNSLQALCQRSLLQEIEDFRIDKALLERRAARELQDLQALVRTLDEELRKRREDPPRAERTGKEDQGPEALRGDLDETVPTVPAHVQSEWFAAQKVEFHDISSDGEDSSDARKSRPPVETQEEEDDGSEVQMPAGLRYVQRIAELEAQSDELKQQLEDLHSSEAALRKDSQEKNDLIAVLLRKAKLPEGRPPGSNGGSHWWNHRSQRTAAEDISELERIVEDTTEDNIRLRNDIKIMSNELRGVLDLQPKKAAQRR